MRGILQSDQFLDRLFDGFYTSPLGQAEFSDTPLTNGSEADTCCTHFPAKYPSAYLYSYLRQHIYNGTPLKARVVYNAHVERLQKMANMCCASIDGGKTLCATPKIRDATDLTSSPNIRKIDRVGTFEGLQLHQTYSTGLRFCRSPQ